MADLGWRCFHCGFYTEDRDEATQHFGLDEEWKPFCRDELAHDSVEARAVQVQLTIELEGERNKNYELDNEHYNLVMDAWIARHYGVMSSEERGYNKGVQDMKKQGYCPEPQKHED